MNASRKIAPFIAITGTSLMVGCDQGNYAGSCGSYGSYGSYGSCGPVAYPAGLYEGSLSAAAQSQSALTIIAENGDGRMSSGGAYYRLKVNTTGSNVTGSFNAFSQSGSLPGGAQSLNGSISGAVTPTNLNATLSGPSSTQQVLSVTFDNAYNTGSSLASLAGNWTSSAGGLTLTATIQSDGSFTGLDSNNCTYDGAFTIIDPSFDTYAETHVRNCAGVTVTFTGLAALFPGTGAGVTGTPTQIQLLTDNGAGDYLVADLE